RLRLLVTLLCQSPPTCLIYSLSLHDALPICIFEFDLQGKTGFFYSFAVLFLVFVLVRRIARSTFGLSLIGIREGGKRMPAIGARSEEHTSELQSRENLVCRLLLDQNTRREYE